MEGFFFITQSVRRHSLIFANDSKNYYNINLSPALLGWMKSSSHLHKLRLANMSFWCLGMCPSPSTPPHQKFSSLYFHWPSTWFKFAQMAKPVKLSGGLLVLLLCKSWTSRFIQSQSVWPPETRQEESFSVALKWAKVRQLWLFFCSRATWRFLAWHAIQTELRPPN